MAVAQQRGCKLPLKTKEDEEFRVYISAHEYIQLYALNASK